MRMPWLGGVIGIALVAVAACGSGSPSPGVASSSALPSESSEAAGSPPPELPSSPGAEGSGGPNTVPDTMSGTWSGTWTETSPDTSTGGFEVTWTQDGTSLTGSITVDGTPCLSSGIITGALRGTKITFGVVQREVLINYGGTVSGDRMSGTYTTNCGDASGRWTASRSS